MNEIGISKKALKKLEKDMEAAYKVHGDRVQVPIMSLSKIFRECRNAVITGTGIDAAMISAISNHRIN